MDRSQVERSKRGPYRRWTITEQCTTIPIDGPQATSYSLPTAIHSKLRKTSGSNWFLCAEPASIEDDLEPQANSPLLIEQEAINNTDRSNLEHELIHDYILPELDHHDENLNVLLDELHSMAQHQHHGELAEDFFEPTMVLEDRTMEVITDEVEIAVPHDSERGKDSDPPLYPGSKRHLGIGMLLLLCFMIRFKLSQETMHYLLVMLQLLLPEKNCLVQSLYGLKKYLAKYTSFPSIHYYCSSCYSLVQKNDTSCPSEMCHHDLTKSGATSYFVQHKLFDQLQNLFKRESFTTQVRTHRFNHLKSVSPGYISDVYDSDLYQHLFNRGFLNSQYNISLAMNTDGVAIFKSSKISMWPVYFLINELPIAERHAKENMLLYGIWIAPRKPVMWSFLKPLFDELSKLENGVNFIDHEGETFLCRTALLTCTCDLPAKCLVTNSMQFNGKYSCWHCMQMGETFRTESGGNCHVFPFQAGDPTGPKRTMDNIYSDVQKCVEKIKSNKTDYITNGCKGPFWLMFLKYFNYADGLVIDSMHCVFEGVMKLLLTLWFGSESRNKVFSFSKFKSEVNDRLSQIRPTINIARVPRSLSDLPYWKASEFRSFLLYWGVPILSTILSHDYFVHFCLLVKATYLLSKEAISDEDLVIAEMCLFEFVKRFEDLYSLRYVTMNVHQLLHLAQNVKATGPLFINNCFIFEDINGFIVSLIHGTQGVDTQVIQSYSFLQAVPTLTEEFAMEDHEVLTYLKELKSSLYHSKCWVNLCPGVYSMDQMKEKCLSAFEVAAIRQKYDIASICTPVWMKTFIKCSNSFVYAIAYKKLLRRNQSVIKYKEGGMVKFGAVKLFACIETNHKKNYIAVVIPFHAVIYDQKDHIHKVQVDLNVNEVTEVQNIVCSCVFVETGNAKFVCEIPNKYDKD